MRDPDLCRVCNRALASASCNAVASLRHALKPLAEMRLSTEAGISDMVYRTPAMELRQQAAVIEQRDYQIVVARRALADTEPAR